MALIRRGIPSFSQRHPFVAVFEGESPDQARSVRSMCESLGARVESLNRSSCVAEILRYMEPCAVISEIALDGRDGFDVMKLVAEYNRNLPLLMLTGRDPVVLGAVDAIEEIWELTDVWRMEQPPSLAGLRAFIGAAGALGPHFSADTTTTRGTPRLPEMSNP